MFCVHFILVEKFSSLRYKRLFRIWAPYSFVRRSSGAISFIRACCRGFADTPKADSTSKHVVVQVQGTEDACGLRVRRARPSDMARILRFVREHAPAAWPHVPAPCPRDSAALVLADYVSRALAQGHSMLAEQTEGRRGWASVRGLALGAAVCPWDASLLERCARCVKCPRARRALHFAAHCLRAPRLHDKYHVHRILQVLMIVPEQSVHSGDLVALLVRGAVQRAADAGIPLVRVDVTTQDIAKILEDLQFKKEWHMEYQVIPESIFEPEADAGHGAGHGAGEMPTVGEKDNTHFVSVYTAPTDNVANAEIDEPPPPTAGFQT